MTVYVEFHLDTRTENQTVAVESPFDSKAKASEKIDALLEETASSSSALLKVRDSANGNFVFINTMKLGHVAVYEED